MKGRVRRNHLIVAVLDCRYVENFCLERLPF